MSSDSVIVSPSQLVAFATTLRESMSRLGSAHRHLRESISTARAVWKDNKYDTFRANLDRCGDELEKFGRMGVKYADFLEEKARLAAKYLNNR